MVHIQPPGALFHPREALQGRKEQMIKMAMAIATVVNQEVNPLPLFTLAQNYYANCFFIALGKL